MLAEKSFVCYFIYNYLYNALLVIICICVEAFIIKVTLLRDLIDSMERTTLTLKTCTMNIASLSLALLVAIQETNPLSTIYHKTVDPDVNRTMLKQ